MNDQSAPQGSCVPNAAPAARVAAELWDALSEDEPDVVRTLAHVDRLLGDMGFLPPDCALHRTDMAHRARLQHEPASRKFVARWSRPSLSQDLLAVELTFTDPWRAIQNSAVLDEFVKASVERFGPGGATLTPRAVWLPGAHDEGARPGGLQLEVLTDGREHWHYDDIPRVVVGQLGAVGLALVAGVRRAAVFAEALDRIGFEFSRETVSHAAWSLQHYDRRPLESGSDLASRLAGLLRLLDSAAQQRYNVRGRHAPLEVALAAQVHGQSTSLRPRLQELSARQEPGSRDALESLLVLLGVSEVAGARPSDGAFCSDYNTFGYIVDHHAELTEGAKGEELPGIVEVRLVSYLVHRVARLLRASTTVTWPERRYDAALHMTEVFPTLRGVRLVELQWEGGWAIHRPLRLPDVQLGDLPATYIELLHSGLSRTSAEATSEATWDLLAPNGLPRYVPGEAVIERLERDLDSSGELSGVDTVEAVEELVPFTVTSRPSVTELSEHSAACSYDPWGIADWTQTVMCEPGAPLIRPDRVSALYPLLGKHDRVRRTLRFGYTDRHRQEVIRREMRLLARVLLRPPSAEFRDRTRAPHPSWSLWMQALADTTYELLQAPLFSDQEVDLDNMASTLVAHLVDSGWIAPGSDEGWFRTTVTGVVDKLRQGDELGPPAFYDGELYCCPSDAERVVTYLLFERQVRRGDASVPLLDPVEESLG